PAPARGRGPVRAASVLAFILEGHLELGAEGFDLALFDHQILLENLRHPEVPQTEGGALDRGFRRLLPGIAARADQLDHFINALRHLFLPRRRLRRARRTRPARPPQIARSRTCRARGGAELAGRTPARSSRDLASHAGTRARAANMRASNRPSSGAMSSGRMPSKGSARSTHRVAKP